MALPRLATQNTDRPSGPEPRTAAVRHDNPDQFMEVAEQSGIHFQLTSGDLDKRYIIEAKGGGGAAWIDYNNDGFPDLFLVNGSTFAHWKTGDSPLSRLYRNNGDGTFADVSGDSGLSRTGWGMGVCVGDYDDDGWDDLYVTYSGGNVLYHNEGNGKFRDVTDKAGVRGHGWSTGCAFGDYDNDGRLDLYVANYVDIDIEHLGEPGSAPNCTYRAIATFCGPLGLPGGRDMLFHNTGNGTFNDVTEIAGIDSGKYNGLGVVWGDYDRDGHPDIYVSNDSTPSALYHNNGNGTFTDVGPQAGVAYSSEGMEQAGMGADFADYDNDSWPDIAKGNFSDDVKNLYHNNGNGTFTDLTYKAAIGDVGWLFTTFGTKFLDYDNDGWKDLFLANGQLFPQIDRYQTGITYKERNLLFHNLHNGRFEEMGLRSGPGLAIVKCSRGLALADYDNDGDVEMLVTNMNDSPNLLHRVSKCPNHSVLVKTVGTRSNRDGIGAEVKVTAAGLVQWDTVRSGGSYLSSSDLRLHFGVGSATRIECLEVRWPSGQADVLKNLPADHIFTVQEGRGLTGETPFRPAVAARLSPGAATRSGSIRLAAIFDTHGSDSCDPAILAATEREIDKGEVAQALQDLQMQSGRCAGSPEYHSLRGLALQKQGKLAESAEEMQTAIRIEPSQPKLYYQFAQVLFQGGDLGAARQLLLRANGLFPHEKWTYLFLAAVYQKFGSVDEARQILNRAVERWPANPEAHVLLANILAAINKHTEATAEYERALALDAGLPQAYLFYGIELNRLDQTDKAILNLSKCAELAPRLPNAHYYLGVAYAKKVDFDRAIRELETTIKLDPQYALAYLQLGKLYRRNGDQVRARQCMDKYGELSLKEKSEGRERTNAILGNLPAQ